MDLHGMEIFINLNVYICTLLVVMDNDQIIIKYLTPCTYLYIHQKLAPIKSHLSIDNRLSSSFMGPD